MLRRGELTSQSVLMSVSMMSLTAAGAAAALTSIATAAARAFIVDWAGAAAG